MSSILWVEDFEDDQFRQFSHAIFGRALNLPVDEFPQELNELRDFLALHQITLATSYAEAARFIKERLDDFDHIVLDIDLNLLGEDIGQDMPLVEPILTRWHGYNSTDENEDSYEAARIKMKKVAGYHLFIELVLNRGFLREKILFCSNHADKLVSINQSFEPAKIEAPEIWTKSDVRVAEWVKFCRDEKYPKLRRWIILACNELLRRNPIVEFTMPGLMRSSDQLFQENGNDLLAVLPLLLPNLCSTKTKPVIFRAFIRTLTQYWEGKMIDFEKVKNQPFEKAISNTLVAVRNWTSHNPNALSQLTEEDIAFFFLITLRVSFKLNSIDLEKFEAVLLKLIGQNMVLSSEQIHIDLVKTYSQVKERWDSLDEKDKTTQRCKVPNDKSKKIIKKDRDGKTLFNTYFNSMLNDLEIAGKLKLKLKPREHEKYILQIFWHQLENINNPNSRNFAYGSTFYKQLAECIYSSTF
jgi:hypothetical protein